MPPVSMANTKLGVGAETQVFDRAWNAVGAAAEIGAVDFDGLAGCRVLVDHGEPAGNRAAVCLGIKAELLARQTVHRGHRLDVVHDGV